MPRKDGSNDESTALMLPNRRNMLKWLGMSSAAALAGCLGGGGGGTDTPADTPEGGGETDTPMGDGTDTPMGDGTETAMGDGTDTAMADGTTAMTETTGNMTTAMGPATGTPAGTTTGTGDGNGTAQGTAQQVDPTMSDQYTLANSSAANTINWIFNTEAGAGALIASTLDGAWAVTNSGTSQTLDDEVFPLWLDVSTEDNQTYTLTVQDGLQWGGDYGQMTADDWVYMLQNLHLAEENWAAYPNYAGFNGEVEQTGDMTFEYTLPEPDAVWKFRSAGGGGFWGGYCVPQELLSQYVEMWQDGSGGQAADGLQTDDELTSLAYTGNLGPYTLENWAQDDEFVATRNENYYMRERDGVPSAWQGAPYYQNYTERVIPEQSARLQALRTGEIDFAPIPPNQVQQYQQNDGVNVYTVDDPYIRQFTFNMRANGFLPARDAAVRRAMMTAINKEAFVQQVLRGYGAPTSTWMPQWSAWYSEEQVTQLGVGDSFSIESARQKLSTALSESDYPHSMQGGSVVDGDGNQVVLSLIAQSNQPTETTMAQLIRQYLTQIGFEVQITKVPGTTFVQNYAYNSVPQDQVDQVPDDWPFPNPTQAGYNKGPRDVATSNEPWDLALIYRFNTYPRTPASSVTFFRERGGINFYGYVPSEGVDIAAMYQEAAQATGEEERQDLYTDVFAAISEEQPVGILMSEQTREGYRADIVGPTEAFGNGWDSTTWFKR